MTNAKELQLIPVIHTMTERQSIPVIVECCTECGKPTHASDSNDDGVCINCLGAGAMVPCEECGESTRADELNDEHACASCASKTDDDEHDAPELINEMMYFAEGGDCSPGGRDTTLGDAMRLFDVIVAQFNSGTMIAQLVDNENDGGRAFEMMRDALDRFAHVLRKLAADSESPRNDSRVAHKCCEEIYAIDAAIKSLANARKLTMVHK